MLVTQLKGIFHGKGQSALMEASPQCGLEGPVHHYVVIYIQYYGKVKYSPAAQNES